MYYQIFHFLNVSLELEILLSVGYKKEDVIYRWNTARQVAIAEDMKLSQFDLIDTPAGNQTYTVSSSTKESSTSRVNKLNSHLGK